MTVGPPLKTDKENLLEKSHQLSRQAVGDAVSPQNVVLQLTNAGAKYVLIGGHMLSFYTGTPRATIDVDVIVSTAHVKKAVEAVSKAYPALAKQDLVYNVRFNSRAEGRTAEPERIDIVRSNTPLFERVIKQYTVPVNTGGQVVHLPTVESAIALKFTAAISPNRGDEKRPQDRADLMLIITRNRSLDQAVLKELGDLAYAGGGEELVTFVKAIHGGKPASL